MNGRIEGSAIGAGARTLAKAVRETPNLIQSCEQIMRNISALRNEHLRINDAISRLQNPRPDPVGGNNDVNHTAPQTLEGRLQEINRELESLLNMATGSAAHLDEAV